MWVPPMRSGPPAGDSDVVPVFVVERYLDGWSPNWVSDVPARLAAGAAVLADGGVRHLGSILLADEETCWCAFEAVSEEAVARVNRELDLPIDRIACGVVVGLSGRRRR